MYNRYIPQPDGSFSRNRMEGKTTSHPPHQEKTESRKQAPQHCDDPCTNTEHHQDPRPRPKDQPITGFLQNLLPKDLDTGDLIIILLLLLLSGDCDEDRSTAMLTLAIYLFL